MMSLIVRCAGRTRPSSLVRPVRFLTSTIRNRLPVSRSATKPVKPVSSTRAVVERGWSEQAQSIASKIYEQGHNELYRNTAVGGYVAASLSVMLLCYGCIGYIYGTKLWDDEVAKERKLDWKVPQVYKITMICWGGLAAYAFSRTLGLVKSIKLIKNGERTMIQTLIRRPIPFMKPELHLAEPHTLIINKGKFFGALQYDNMIVASEGTSLISRITRMLFYNPFHNTRKTLGGVGLVPIQVGLPGSQRHLFLDTDGLFSNGGKDLLEIAKDEFE